MRFKPGMLPKRSRIDSSSPGQEEGSLLSTMSREHCKGRQGVFDGPCLYGQQIFFSLLLLLGDAGGERFSFVKF